MGDAAARIARVLSLQLLTNFGFAVLVGTEPVRARHAQRRCSGACLPARSASCPMSAPSSARVLPTLIAFAVMPGWLQPLLVLGCIVALDILVGQLVEPLLFGEFDGRHPPWR